MSFIEELNSIDNLVEVIFLSKLKVQINFYDQSILSLVNFSHLGSTRKFQPKMVNSILVERRLRGRGVQTQNQKIMKIRVSSNYEILGAMTRT